MQAGHILGQILTPEQYAVNVVTRRGGTERVEFAIRLPGQDDGTEGVVWLPMDAAGWGSPSGCSTPRRRPTRRPPTGP